MALYKDQHYVPRFYLKNFSNCNTIGIYNLKARQFFRRSYRALCSKKYFYSKDSKFEKAISPIEGRYSKAINRLAKAKDLSKLDPNDYCAMLSFVVFQNSRTSRQKLNSQRMLGYETEVLKEALRLNKPDISEELINTVEIKSNVHFFRMGYALTCGPLLISDLNSKIIINRSTRDFLISDEPVIFYNARFNDMGYGTTGFQTPGLQIFCPLNPKTMLIFYDKEYYDFGLGNKINVFLDSDVDSLNLLQLFNANGNIFFSNDNHKNYIKKLHSKIDFLLDNCSNAIEMTTHSNKEDNSKIFCLSAPSINYNLDLSFMIVKPIIRKEIPRSRSKELIEIGDDLMAIFKKKHANEV